ncbi:MAG TPA: hypothetical protein VE078_17400, partial [Thermoanaerobaculia bacterium]|nr:hypothetical protein [Thermoanaerobaculia bacterium]
TLAEEGLLQAAAPDRPSLRVESLEGLIRARGTVRMLHLAKAAEAGLAVPSKAPARAIPPPGVDAGAFFDLVEFRRLSRQ